MKQFESQLESKLYFYYCIYYQKDGKDGKYNLKMHPHYVKQLNTRSSNYGRAINQLPPQDAIPFLLTILQRIWDQKSNNSIFQKDWNFFQTWIENYCKENKTISCVEFIDISTNKMKQILSNKDIPFYKVKSNDSVSLEIINSQNYSSKLDEDVIKMFCFIMNPCFQNNKHCYKGGFSTVFNQLMVDFFKQSQSSILSIYESSNKLNKVKKDKKDKKKKN
jgi:hypothetical protein